MAEYIDRESLIKRFCERCNEEMSESPCEPSDCFSREVIKTIPAADVAPVRHGRWEWFEEWNQSTPDHPTECEDFGWRCGKCKTSLEDVVGLWDNPDEEPALRYCPNCGAKMDGKEDHNE